MSKLKGERKVLSYVWTGDVMTVTDPQSKRVERFDFNLVPESLDREFWEFGRRTKVGNYASKENGGTPNERLDAMVEGFGYLKDGDWKREREPLPNWIKTAEMRLGISAMALIRGYSERDVRAKLLEFGEKRAAEMIKSEAVVAKVKEITAGGPVDLSSFE